MVATPLSADELYDRAELVVEARVQSRANGRALIGIQGVLKGEPRLHKQRGWRAWFGGARTVLVRFSSQPPEPVPGDWWNEGAFVPGYRIRAYLYWDAGAGCYASVWWNGIDVLP